MNSIFGMSMTTLIKVMAPHLLSLPKTRVMSDKSEQCCDCSRINGECLMTTLLEIHSSKLNGSLMLVFPLHMYIWCSTIPDHIVQ